MKIIMKCAPVYNRHNVFSIIIVTRPAKINHVGALIYLRNTNLKYSMPHNFLVPDSNCVRFTVVDKKVPISIACTRKERNKNIFRMEMVRNILNVFGFACTQHYYLFHFCLKMLLFNFSHYSLNKVMYKTGVVKAAVW